MITKDIATQSVKILLSENLMTISHIVDNNGHLKDCFRISTNKEKEWKRLVSCARAFDLPISITCNLLIKYRKPLIIYLLFPLIVLAIGCFVFPLFYSPNETQQRDQNNKQELQEKPILMHQKKYDT